MLVTHVLPLIQPEHLEGRHGSTRTYDDIPRPNDLIARNRSNRSRPQEVEKRAGALW